MTTCMLSGVFHMLSALCIWFVLFDLRYLVLRVHDDGLCLMDEVNATDTVALTHVVKATYTINPD